MASKENDCNEDQLEIVPVEAEINQKLLQDYRGERTAFVQAGPNKTFMYKKYETLAQNILDFKVRSDDVWLLGFPRSGTTLTQELVWLVSENVDIERAKEEITRRFPNLELNALINEEVTDELRLQYADLIEEQPMILKVEPNQIDLLDKMPSPRYIRCHLPFELLPKDLLTSGAKVFYVARNPKDVAVSFYYLNKTFRCFGYTGDFVKYWDNFEKGLTLFAPYWPHVIGGWERRKHPNLHFILYEDLVKDMKTAILKISSFLNKKLTDDQLETLMDHLQFQNFKKNPAVNCEMAYTLKFCDENGQFIRKGKVGDWVDEFTPELSKRADLWIAENLMKTDLRFSV